MVTSSGDVKFCNNTSTDLIEVIQHLTMKIAGVGGKK